MARLGSQSKMGFYPTPDITLKYVSWFLDTPCNGNKPVNILDPCCGEGDALKGILKNDNNVVTWGVELDTERASTSFDCLNNVICASIFDVRLNPLGSMGLLWLNPPYDTENGKRVEMEFLKHSIKWLRFNGVLVFIIPECVLENEKNRGWIGEHFTNIKVFNAHRDDYPTYKQVVLFGIKRPDRVENGDEILPPPYPFIEDVDIDIKYLIPSTSGPTVFQGEECITDDEILKNRPILLAEVDRIIGRNKTMGQYLSPVLPLKKAHMISLLTAGIVDGEIDDGIGYPIIIKGFSDRLISKRTEDNKEITKNTYMVGIRVMERTRWYDIS